MPNNNRVPLIVTGVLILVSLGALAFFVVSGINKPQNAIPSHATGTTTDPTKCQGNPNPDPKCFKCETGTNKNNPIGVLDFTCFKNFYGQTVGK